MAIAALNPLNSDSWLDQVLDDFERSLLRKGLSPNTVRAYRWDVEDLFGYLRDHGVTQLTDLRRDHLERWQDRMVEKHWSASTRQQAIAGVRQLIGWAADHDIVDMRLLRSLAKVKKRQHRPRPIPPDDLAKIKAYLIPRRRKEHIIHLRDRALFFYLLTTGARVSEALQVTRAEIVDEIGRAHV